MGNMALGLILAIVAAVLLLFSLAWATGAPSSPTASISGAITPGSAQTLQITFQTQVESTTPPNSIWQLPPSFAYSITETSATQGTTVIAQQAHVPTSVSPASHWPVYILTGTISVSTVAVCSSSCAGVVSNITVTVAAQTWGGGLSSPTATIVFSSNPGFQSIPSVGPLNVNSYLQQSLGAGLAGGGLAALAVASVRPHLYVLGGGVASLAIGVASLAFL